MRRLSVHGVFAVAAAVCAGVLLWQGLHWRQVVALNEVAGVLDTVGGSPTPFAPRSRSRQSGPALRGSLALLANDSQLA